MTDEQLLRLICDHTGKRINLPNFTLDELKDFARGVLAAAAPGAVPAPAQDECKYCGHVGPVEPPYLACCPKC